MCYLTRAFFEILSGFKIACGNYKAIIQSSYNYLIFCVYLDFYVTISYLTIICIQSLHFCCA